MKERSIRGILLEVFSIVLGVLLALAVSEWQQDREKDELAANALANVHNELRANQELLSALHASNKKTIELAAVEAAGDAEVDESLQFTPGVQVRATAWNALQSSGVSNHVDYDVLLDLSGVYSVQAVYRQTGTQLVDASMSIAAMATVSKTELDNRVFQQQFMPYFTMMLAMEEALLQAYAETLESLEAVVAE